MNPGVLTRRHPIRRRARRDPVSPERGHTCAECGGYKPRPVARLCMSCYTASRKNTPEQFWAKVDRSAGPEACWDIEGTPNIVTGYVEVRVSGRRVGAHRHAYELAVGPIPVDRQIDHLCRNRACVNPSHMEPVTIRENVLRGEGPTALNARRTTCANGHPFDRVDQTGKRRCSICGRQKTANWRARRAKKDPVSAVLRLAVLERDGGCIAPRLGGSAADCWGRLTIEHVKAELRMGRRGEHMVSLCQGHTEDGRKAGFQWNTNAENRTKVRAYLEVVSE
jgi:hypothetical protein